MLQHSRPTLAAMRSLATWLLVAAGLLVDRAANAKPAAKTTVPASSASQPETEEADQLFEEGRRLVKVGDFTAACPRFEQSDKLKRTFGTAVNLGDCALHDEQLERAWLLYDEAVRLAKREGNDDLVLFARERVADIKPQLCRLIITVADPTVAGLEIHVGDRDFRPARRILTYVDPGDIEVVVTAPQALGLRQTLRGSAGEVLTLEVPADTTKIHGEVLAGVGPGFVAIDRLDARSRIGIATSYNRMTPEASGMTTDPTLLRFEGHARYVDKATGFGGYAHVPYAYQSGTGEASFGNLELGAILVPGLGIRHVNLVMHGGIILPTGSGTQDVGHKASLLALPELYNSFNNATTIRLGLSSLFSDGDTFAQIDIGVDWSIQSDTPLGTGLHVNAGLGLRAGPLALTFESENAAIVDFSAGSQVMCNALAVSLRTEVGTASPYLAVVKPLEKDISKSLMFGVLLGADFKLP